MHQKRKSTTCINRFKQTKYEKEVIKHKSGSLRLRKSEYKEEWYLIVEAYPVYDPCNPKRKRVIESINRIIRTPIWDKSSVIGITPDGDYKYRPKRDVNGVILCSSKLDQESCIYADEVRKLRQHEYDSAIIYTDKEAEILAQNERGEQDFIKYFEGIIYKRHPNSSDSIIVNWERVAQLLKALFSWQAHTIQDNISKTA